MLTTDFGKIRAIPQEMLPMLVLSDNLRSFFSAGIKFHEKGSYNHLMWMIRPGLFASQNTMFKEVPIDKFEKAHRIKLWHNPLWTPTQRAAIIKAIQFELDQPWYKRGYDYLQIFGKLTGLDWLQVPWRDICSDKADHLRRADRSYNLKHPSPTEVNAWLKSRSAYQVYMRYTPD